MQRWAVLDQLIAERGADAQCALIDADTMIRWDTPDIFALAKGFSAVADQGAPRWILRSAKAFQPLFPETSLPWWEYFNSGFIVLGAAQRPFIRAFLDFSVKNWPRLDAAMTSGDLGTEQTPLNFMVKREKEPVFFLPRPFNFVNCFPLPAELAQVEQIALTQAEHSVRPDPALFAAKAFGRPIAFEFVELAYVWHFTNVVTFRSLVMGETGGGCKATIPARSCGRRSGRSPTRRRKDRKLQVVAPQAGGEPAPPEDKKRTGGFSN
jgi:hypothetical protein